jgi:predicted enzyme related to lactoylglutathione lyase
VLVPVTHVFAGIPVADRDAAVEFYARLFGRPPDLIPNAKEAAWGLTEEGWLYVVADAERAGSALNALLVDDLDAFLAGLAERGIEAGAPDANAAGVRRVYLSDPDGNRLQVGQPPR